MLKLHRIFTITILFSSLAIQAATPQETNLLKRQYQSFVADIKLINKCYFKKSPACSANERQQARKAIGRVTAKGLAMIGLIVAAGFVGYVGRKKYARWKLLQQEQELTGIKQVKVDPYKIEDFKRAFFQTSGQAIDQARVNVSKDGASWINISLAKNEGEAEASYKQRVEDFVREPKPMLEKIVNFYFGKQYPNLPILVWWGKDSTMKGFGGFWEVPLSEPN